MKNRPDTTPTTTRSKRKVVLSDDEPFTEDDEPSTKRPNRNRRTLTRNTGDEDNTGLNRIIALLEQLVQEFAEPRSETRERLQMLEIRSREANKPVFDSVTKIQQIHARLQLENLKSVKLTFTEQWMVRANFFGSDLCIVL